uniref:Uncharacterized protein n=1 Tax=Acrobeloides nanus TaxID=290746 RepID=A0A914D3J6_9BILA
MDNRKLLPGKEADTLVELYNESSLIHEDDDRIVYLFDYVNKKTTSGSFHGEIINRHVLKDMKNKNQWNLIRHPLVLNFINEKILSCTLFYTTHILAYFFFLFLLYSYVQLSPSIFRNMLVTSLVIFFLFFMLIKAVLKLQTGYTSVSLCVSLWFQISYLFNLITLIITLAFVWTPYIFNFDNYNLETKRTIAWFLPIVAIISSWVNCLYILRKAPCGPYILMMIKILRSFLNTAIIWIPTLFCFAFAFQLIMRDSGTEPWDDPEIKNASDIIMAMFQSFTKTSAMMIGEVEANDILMRKTWIANTLLILFEIITVIILINLMISLAVGDVSELRASAEDRLLKIKVNFCIEALHLSEFTDCLEVIPFIHALHKTPTNNVLVVHKNTGHTFSTYFRDIHTLYFENNRSPYHNEKDNQTLITSVISMNPEDVNMQIRNPPTSLHKSSIRKSVLSTVSMPNSPPSNSSVHRTLSGAPSSEYYTASVCETNRNSCASPSSTSVSFYSINSNLPVLQKQPPLGSIETFLSATEGDQSFYSVREEKDDDRVYTERHRIYDLVLNTSGIKVRKEALSNRATLMSMQGATFRLVESSTSGIATVVHAENKTELENLTDQETYWRKYQRWLIGLNWKALLLI